MNCVENTFTVHICETKAMLLYCRQVLLFSIAKFIMNFWHDCINNPRTFLIFPVHVLLQVVFEVLVTGLRFQAELKKAEKCMLCSSAFRSPVSTFTDVADILRPGTCMVESNNSESASQRPDYDSNS